ncbi:MAG: hypothetical protein ACPHID_00235 [Thermoplasmatota archaeon]
MTPMKNQMIDHLRAAGRPLSHAALARLYADPQQRNEDRDQLRRQRLVRLDGRGIHWTRT